MADPLSHVGLSQPPDPFARRKPEPAAIRNPARSLWQSGDRVRRKHGGLGMLDAYSRGGLDYRHCRYGTSRLAFRGPEARAESPYVAALGGSATFGKFVAQPWPVPLGKGHRRPGRSTSAACMPLITTPPPNKKDEGRGDHFADDASLMSICSGAEAVGCADHRSALPRQQPTTASIRAATTVSSTPRRSSGRSHPEVDFHRVPLRAPPAFGAGVRLAARGFLRGGRGAEAGMGRAHARPFIKNISF